MDIERTFGKRHKQSPSHAMVANSHTPLSQATSSTLRHSTIMKPKPNAQTERLRSPAAESMQIVSKARNSSKKDHSLSKGTYGEYRSLRESKAQELTEELQQISDS